MDIAMRLLCPKSCKIKANGSGITEEKNPNNIIIFESKICLLGWAKNTTV